MYTNWYEFARRLISTPVFLQERFFLALAAASSMRYNEAMILFLHNFGEVRTAGETVTLRWKIPMKSRQWALKIGKKSISLKLPKQQSYSKGRTVHRPFRYRHRRHGGHDAGDGSARDRWKILRIRKMTWRLTERTTLLPRENCPPTLKSAILLRASRTTPIWGRYSVLGHDHMYRCLFMHIITGRVRYTILAIIRSIT